MIGVGILTRWVGHRDHFPRVLLHQYFTTPDGGGGRGVTNWHAVGHAERSRQAIFHGDREPHTDERHQVAAFIGSHYRPGRRPSAGQPILISALLPAGRAIAGGGISNARTIRYPRPARGPGVSRAQLAITTDRWSTIAVISETEQRVW